MLLDHEPGKKDILSAAKRIGPYLHRTPVLTSSTIDAMTGAHVFFKCENFQKAGAFKARGATNTIFSYAHGQLVKGVATHSSGNHAAALAMAASICNIPVYVVMPENSSPVKIAAVKSYGGRITFCKATLQAREDTLAQVLNETGATEIHPYNNYNIIAGQATAALELLTEKPELDIMVSPVGGGGLLSGTSLATHNWSPKTKIIGAEPSGADDACRSLAQKTLIPVSNPETVADGLRTSLGTRTFPIILRLVDEILTVDDKMIVEAMFIIWERMKIIIEPSSAVALAVVLKYRDYFAGKRTGIILSGGNVDLKNLPW